MPFSQYALEVLRVVEIVDELKAKQVEVGRIESWGARSSSSMIRRRRSRRWSRSTSQASNWLRCLRRPAALVTQNGERPRDGTPQGQVITLFVLIW